MIDTFIKRVERKGLLTILAVGIVTIFLWDGRTSVSLISGGLLGLINLRWITKTVKGILEAYSESLSSKLLIREGSGPARVKKALLLIYFLKLGVLSLILIIVLKAGKVNPPALLAGFTIIILIILFEGIISAKKI